MSCSIKSRAKCARRLLREISVRRSSHPGPCPDPILALLTCSGELFARTGSVACSGDTRETQ
eukprot:7288527-Alexandrium_andersonii.AAC.1